jgi:hypothetical protein
MWLMTQMLVLKLLLYLLVLLLQALDIHLLVVINSGSTTTGNSKVAINGIATTLSLPMRIVDVVEETTDASGNYTEVIVKWNAPYENSNVATGGHAYMVATGL